MDQADTDTDNEDKENIEKWSSSTDSETTESSASASSEPDSDDNTYAEEDDDDVESEHGVSLLELGNLAIEEQAMNNSKADIDGCSSSSNPTKALPSTLSPELPLKPAVEDEDELVKNIKIGEHHLVQRSDGRQYLAEIVEVRQDQEGEPEYYVHYEGLNRRMDEWIKPKQIEKSGLALTPKRKAAMTRTATTYYDRVSKPYSYPPLSKGMADLSIAGLEENDTRKITRSLMRKHAKINHVETDLEELGVTTAALERAYEETTKIKYIKQVQFGMYEVDTWYFAPYPDEYGDGSTSKIWICEFCLMYMKTEQTFRQHMASCNRRQPPGIEVYRKGILSIYEIDGVKNKTYCQSLCLLSKLFLDHKTTCFSVDPFLFYILCEVSPYGAHPAGYFSKAKDSGPECNNVACILTLPPYQRKGYGKLLIDFSYELSKREGKIGTPEKPLSDLGKLSYRSYWTWVLLEALRNCQESIPTVEDLSEMTYIAEPDVISTLQSLNMIKYWKGQNVICTTPKNVDEYMVKSKLKKPILLVDSSRVRWKPRKWGNQ